MGVWSAGYCISHATRKNSKKVTTTMMIRLRDEPKYFAGSSTADFLPLGEAVASRVIFVIVSVSNGRTGGNAFGSS